MSCPPAVNVYISGCGIVVDIPNPYITNQQFTNALNINNYSNKDSLTLNSTLGQLPQINNPNPQPDTPDQTKLRDMAKDILAAQTPVAPPQIDHIQLQNFLYKEGVLSEEDICRLQDWCIISISRLHPKELASIALEVQNSNVKTRSKTPFQTTVYSMNSTHGEYTLKAYDDLALVPINVLIEGTSVSRYIYKR